MIQDTDPADTDPLRPGGQPEILNGATGAIQIRGSHRGAPEHRWSATPPAARDA